MFFSSYESAKSILTKKNPLALPDPVIHMIAASFGETMACLVRVPTEVVKQRMQANMSNSILETVNQINRHEGGVLGLFKGFGITLMREIPFSLVQFPLYEYFKVKE